MTGMTAGREGRDKGFSHDPEMHLNRNRMDLYLAIVVIMLVLAVAGLVVGVSNDAVNFLNSALGSKAAPRYVIMTVASVGIIVGAITSSGMMEVARSGVFHPQMFTFAEVMLLFLAVMFTNVILLDLFNTLGMPTSTTVSLVFGLLGAAVGICVFKLSSGSVVTMPDGDPASMADMINTGNAMAIIGGILISVAIAFVCGTVVMYITRLIFSFRYQKKLRVSMERPFSSSRIFSLLPRRKSSIAVKMPAGPAPMMTAVFCASLIVYLPLFRYFYCPFRHRRKFCGPDNSRPSQALRLQS